MICLRCLKPASLGCRRVHLNTKRLVYHLSRTTPTRLFGNLTIAGDHHGDAALPAPPRCLSGSESRRKAQTVRSRCNSSALALASYVGWGSFSAPNGVVLTSSSKLSRRARAAICGVRGWLPPLLFRSRLSTVLRARVSAAVSRPGLPLLTRKPVFLGRLQYLGDGFTADRRTVASSAARTNSTWRIATGARSKP
jgi:hypothetical protein